MILYNIIIIYKTPCFKHVRVLLFRKFTMVRRQTYIYIYIYIRDVYCTHDDIYYGHDNIFYHLSRTPPTYDLLLINIIIIIVVFQRCYGS